MRIRAMRDSQKPDVKVLYAKLRIHSITCLSEISNACKRQFENRPETLESLTARPETHSLPATDEQFLLFSRFFTLSHFVPLFRSLISIWSRMVKAVIRVEGRGAHYAVMEMAVKVRIRRVKAKEIILQPTRVVGFLSLD